MVKNSQKMTKNDEKMKILKKKFWIFFAQNRFRINSKAFLVKMSVLKFFQKMVKNGQKWPKMIKHGQKWTFLKKKIEKFFLIDLECFKTYKQNFDFQKKIPQTIFSGTLPFFDEIGQILKIFKKSLSYVELVRSSLRARMAQVLPSD